MLLDNKSAVIYGGGGSIGGAVVAFDAIETIRCQPAVELGRHGVRVVTLASGGVPESLPEGFERRQAIVEMIEGQTLLGRAAMPEDVGNAAAFAASDWRCHDGGDRQRQRRRARRLVEIR